MQVVEKSSEGLSKVLSVTITVEDLNERLDAKIAEKMGGAPAIVGTCLAYGTDSPVIRRRWPELYTGPVDEADVPAAAE